MRCVDDTCSNYLPTQNSEEPFFSSCLGVLVAKSNFYHKIIIKALIGPVRTGPPLQNNNPAGSGTNTVAGNLTRICQIYISAVAGIS